MQRRWLLVPILALAAVCGGAPILAATARAAEPTVVVRPGDTLTSIAERHGITVRQLVRRNDIRDPNRIYAGQRLRVTGGRSSKPAAPSAAPAAKKRSHAVQSGDTLTHIARRYGVSVSAIVAANRLADAGRIYAGQRLTIPGAAAPTAPRPSAAPAAKKRSHAVQSGDTLTHIARRYGVSVSAIVAANRLADAGRIYAGQRLTIPGAAAPTAPRPATRKAATPSIPASMAALVTKRDGVRRIIVEEAKRHRVPVGLALAVAWQESGWQQGVVSHAGAIGVMQLLPSTGEWVGATMLRSRVNVRDTRQNVRAGVRLLAHYRHRYNGNVDLVLAAYYQGQTAADRHGVYAVSRPYIASIKVLARIFGS